MKKILNSVASSLVLFLFFSSQVFAEAINIAPPEKAVLKQDSTSVSNVIQFIINTLILVGVITALAFLIYGGIRWILSGGDKTAVEAARGHIVAAIIGLIIIVAAYVIVDLVLKTIGVSTGLQTSFSLPTLKSPGL